MEEKKPVILITGVCGRIGMAAARLFGPDYQIVGLDVRFPENPPPYMDCIFTDLSNRENVLDTCKEVEKKYGREIASCIHLAAYYNFTGGSWDKYEAITINGTKHLLEGLASFQLEQFLFSSTMLVHAPCRLDQKINEDSPLDPKWEYPLSKVKTEELIEEMKGRASSVILRIAGVYDDACNSIPISQHISRIYEKQLESHLFPGNPDHGATFLHMDDLMSALKQIVEKRGALSPSEVFVLGEPEMPSYKTLQHELGELIHGKPWWTMRIPKFLAKMGAYLKGWLPFTKKSFIKPWMVDLADDTYILDITKAKEQLGWEPAYKLKNCLPQMVDELKKDPQNWYARHGL